MDYLIVLIISVILGALAGFIQPVVEKYQGDEEDKLKNNFKSIISIIIITACLYSLGYYAGRTIPYSSKYYDIHVTQQDSVQIYKFTEK